MLGRALEKGLSHVLLGGLLAALFKECVAGEGARMEIAVPDCTPGPHPSIIDSCLRLRGVNEPTKIRVLAKQAEPRATLGSPRLRCTISAMKTGAGPKSRRWSQQPLGRKTFVYMTEEERTLVDQAAAAKRTSVSSFIANTAVEVAERSIARHQ